jgi:putative endonuclease
MNSKQYTGERGELAAQRYLEGKGHLILHTNYRIGHKEIDIISSLKQVLVFTEVKTRTQYQYGYPEEGVTLKKQILLKEAAMLFCEMHPQYQQIRFDVISILWQHKKAIEIVHFEDAFY